jgi:hypothetical protein
LQMNRKLITSKDLLWPDIDEKTSETIVRCIEEELAKYPEIKRPKTLPKRQREHIKKQKLESSDDKEKTDEQTVDNYKFHFLNGINTITRFLEKPENLDKILCILVCKSCKRILIQHLLFISSQHNIKAGCVANLSKVLPKLFNIKTLSAVAIRKCYDVKYRQTQDKFEKVILPLLPNIENPFGMISEANGDFVPEQRPAMLEKYSLEVDEKPVEKRFKTINDIFVMKVDDQVETRPFKQSFEFISFSKEASVDTDLPRFNEKNFILYAQSADTDDNRTIDDESQDEGAGGRYFEKRADGVVFKQFNIVNRKPNPNRVKKIKKKPAKNATK